MKEFRFKGSEKFLATIHAFSATEKVVFAFFTLIALISALSLAWKVNSLFLIPIPAHGGSFSEGMIGLPRSINPVLAFTETDKNLSNLIYSGLMKFDGDKIVKDIAETYTVSEDGLVYDFKIKDNIRFHDGTQLTTDDIEFTIQKIQDNEIKSPKYVDWASVIIKKISPTEIQFVLRQPYAPFLSNTTIGIIPKNIWKNQSPEQFIFNQKNLEPIGSGPYKVNNIVKDKAGTPTSYKLSSFNKYHNGEPFISDINIIFYQNEDMAIDAFKSGIINNFAGISPQKSYEISSSTQNVNIIHNPLPRIFGVFFNQNNSPVLANKEVRQALNMVVDKDAIIQKALYGYAVSINSPIPLNEATSTTKKEEIDIEKNIQSAKDLLSKSGWAINENGILEKKTKTTKQTLELSISTADSTELKLIAEMVKKSWEELGAKVTVKVYEFGDLSQNIIKTRKYDTLLFGEIINKDLDLYAFWHSSQRNSPGLNVSMYVNSKADKILEDARTSFDEKAKDSLYKSFEEIIKDDVPAIFLYSPEYLYMMSKEIKGYDMKTISSPSDRFSGIDKWYIKTDKVWEIFVKDTETNK
jgi:peptide/nickel transport system substrate-binding protein